MSQDMIQVLHERCDGCGSVFPEHRCSVPTDWRERGLITFVRRGPRDA